MMTMVVALLLLLLLLVDVTSWSTTKLVSRVSPAAISQFALESFHSNRGGNRYYNQQRQQDYSEYPNTSYRDDPYSNYNYRSYGPSQQYRSDFPTRVDDSRRYRERQERSTGNSAANDLFGANPFQRHMTSRNGGSGSTRSQTDTTQSQQRWNEPSSSSSSDRYNSNDDSSFQLRVYTELDDATLRRVSHFLVESYWLGSSRLWVHNDAGRPVSQFASHAPPHLNNRQWHALVDEQAADLSLKFSPQSRQYGSSSQRRLKSTLIVATNTAANSHQESMVGMVCLHELMLNTEHGRLLTVPESERYLDDIVQNLPPTMRHNYQTASVHKICQTVVSKYAPSSLMPVLVLCNLVVAPMYRRQGLATRLCNYAHGYNSRSSSNSRRFDEGYSPRYDESSSDPYSNSRYNNRYEANRYGSGSGSISSGSSSIGNSGYSQRDYYGQQSPTSSTTSFSKPLYSPSSRSQQQRSSSSQYRDETESAYGGSSSSSSRRGPRREGPDRDRRPDAFLYAASSSSSSSSPSSSSSSTFTSSPSSTSSSFKSSRYQSIPHNNRHETSARYAQGQSNYYNGQSSALPADDQIPFHSSFASPQQQQYYRDTGAPYPGSSSSTGSSFGSSTPYRSGVSSSYSQRGDESRWNRSPYGQYDSSPNSWSSPREPFWSRPQPLAPPDWSSNEAFWESSSSRTRPSDRQRYDNAFTAPDWSSSRGDQSWYSSSSTQSYMAPPSWSSNEAFWSAPLKSSPSSSYSRQPYMAAPDWSDREPFWDPNQRMSLDSWHYRAMPWSPYRRRTIQDTPYGEQTWASEEAAREGARMASLRGSSQWPMYNSEQNWQSYPEQWSSNEQHWNERRQWPSSSSPDEPWSSSPSSRQSRQQQQYSSPMYASSPPLQPLEPWPPSRSTSNAQYGSWSSSQPQQRQQEQWSTMQQQRTMHHEQSSNNLPIVLKVESSNDSALRLYRGLGYEPMKFGSSGSSIIRNDPAIRLNVQTGELVEIKVDAQILIKSNDDVHADGSATRSQSRARTRGWPY